MLDAFIPALEAMERGRSPKGRVARRAWRRRDEVDMTSARGPLEPCAS